MSFTSFRFSGSSGNPSLAWSMGNGGKGRLIIEFPFALNTGWYAEQDCIEFRTFEHRKERKGFRHEFIVLKLLDGSVCRVERMGDPNARFDALSHQGSIAYDMIQRFKPADVEQACLTTSDIVAQITLPCVYDLLDVLKICRAIHEGEKTRNYTLQVFNCYFFSLALQVCLTRLVAHWEDEQLFKLWLLDLAEGVKHFAESFQPAAEQALLRHEPVPFRLHSALIPHKCYSSNTLFLLEKIKSKFQSEIGNSERLLDIRKGLAYRINNLLWYSAIHSAWDQLIEEICQDTFIVSITESVNAHMIPLAPSSESSYLKHLSDQLLVILTKMLALPKWEEHASNSSISNPHLLHSRVIKQKPLVQPTDPGCTSQESADFLPSPELSKSKISLLSFNGKPKVQIAQNLVLDWCQWISQNLPYLALWVLYTCLGVWGIMIFSVPADAISCTCIEKELGDLLTGLERMEAVTCTDIERFTERVRALTRHHALVWNNNPWSEMRYHIQKYMSPNVLEAMEDHKPKVIFYSELIDFMHKYNLAEEMAEPRAVNISVFQHHILARIRSHAETVERAWLGSAASIKIELEGVLSQVWKLIREDNDMLDKMQRAIADGTLQTDGPENESVQLRWTIADLDDEEFLRLLEEKLSGSGHLRDIRMLMDPIMGVDDREPGPRSDRESDSDDSYTESEWVRARHAMMGVRKIVRTEKQYLRHLIAFLGDEDAVRMSSILAEHLPQMLETSRRFCACLEEDPSAKGVSEAFLDMEEALDTTFVQWSSAVSEGVSSMQQRAKSPAAGGDDHANANTEGGLSRQDFATDESDSVTLHSTNLSTIPVDIGYSSDRRSTPGTKFRKITEQDVMIMLTQRMARYVQMYQDLLLYTPVTSSSHLLVKRALQSATRIAQRCEEAHNDTNNVFSLAL